MRKQRERYYSSVWHYEGRKAVITKEPDRDGIVEVVVKTDGTPERSSS